MHDAHHIDVLLEGDGEILELLTEAEQGPPGPPGLPGESGVAAISADGGNRARAGSDSGVYVPDDLIPDPLAYYILAKG